MLVYGYFSLNVESVYSKPVTTFIKIYNCTFIFKSNTK